MTTLTGDDIRKLCMVDAFRVRKDAIVFPFAERTVKNGMSYGVSYAGYDIRVRESFTLWPGSFKLCSSVERFQMPANVIGVVHDKSTWARRGIAAQNTVLEPGWEGYLTMELSNHHPWWKFWKRVHIRSGDPIAQILFHKTSKAVKKTYAGKYQGQEAKPVEARAEVTYDDSSTESP